MVKLLLSRVSALALFATLTGFFYIGFYHFKLTGHPDYLSQASNLTYCAMDSSTLQSILNHPFSYLDEGCQTVVFESFDHNYVLKISKFPTITKLFSHDVFSSITQKNPKFKRKKEALELAVKSLILCFNKFKKESQLLYLSIFDETQKNFHLEVRDKWGFSHKLKISDCIFSIQKKGRLFADVFFELSRKKEVDKAKSYLDSLFRLIQKERSSFILDKDANVLKNFGFIESEAALIDTAGLMRTSHPKHYKKQIEKVKKTLLPWLKSYFPELEEYACQLIEIEENSSYLELSK